MDLQMDYADLCMMLLKKCGDDPGRFLPGRMLLEYAEVRWAKIGMSLGKYFSASGENVDWEAFFSKSSEKVFSVREEQTGETVKMVWPFPPAAAWLCARGNTGIAGEVTAAADALIANGHRDRDGLFDNPAFPGHISTEILAMTLPFLAWAGKISGQKCYFDEAVRQFRGYAARLYDPAAGLWHPGFLPAKATDRQAVRWICNEYISSDFPLQTPGVVAGCWGRGEGYALFALSELIFELPDGQEKTDLIGMRAEMLERLLAHQDPNGMWHQVLNDWGSYPETSGTGWILYAMGRAVKQKTVDREKFLPPYLRGLAGIARYLSCDGGTFNGSGTCICPAGRGTAVDFALCPWWKDEPHTAAPVLLALQQAVQNEHGIHLIPCFSDVLNQFSGE